MSINDINNKNINKNNETNLLEFVSMHQNLISIENSNQEYLFFMKDNQLYKITKLKSNNYNINNIKLEKFTHKIIGNDSYTEIFSIKEGVISKSIHDSLGDEFIKYLKGSNKDFIHIITKLNLYFPPLRKTIKYYISFKYKEILSKMEKLKTKLRGIKLGVILKLLEQLKGIYSSVDLIDLRSLEILLLQIDLELQKIEIEVENHDIIIQETYNLFLEYKLFGENDNLFQKYNILDYDILKSSLNNFNENEAIKILYQLSLKIALKLKHINQEDIFEHLYFHFILNKKNKKD